MTSRNTLSFAEKIELANVLKRHARTVDGLCVYDEGWSDERVMAHFAGRVTLTNVRNIRRQIMGNLKPSREQEIYALVQQLAKRVGVTP